MLNLYDVIIHNMYSIMFNRFNIMLLLLLVTFVCNPFTLQKYKVCTYGIYKTIIYNSVCLVAAAGQCLLYSGTYL